MRIDSRRVLVFSDDWGRHPSSCQHLIRHLLNEVDVCWVNTLGTRRPAWNAYTLKRGLTKIGSWTNRGSGRPVEDPDRPLVLDPMMWPSFRSRWARRANRHLLESAIGRTGFVDENCVAVTTLPLVADLVGRLGAFRWVYYCVDDLSVWPGLDGAVLAEMEQRLVSVVDRIVVVSEHLADKMAARGHPTDLLSHGLDLELWRRADAKGPAFIDRLPRPLVVFWGVVDKRLDLGTVAELSRRLTRGTILFIGPENEPDPSLADHPNVTLAGPIPYPQLPDVGRKADVLMMPYANLPVTRAIQPLKFKEYLATGKPVVVTDLPAIGPWRDACDVASSPEDFAQLVMTRAQSGTPERQLTARRRLEGESWKAKSDTFYSLLFD